MLIMAIDPGNKESGYVVIDLDGKIYARGKISNERLRSNIITRVETDDIDMMAIEMPASYGMAVGATVFETCRWVGIFSESAFPINPVLIYRKSPNKDLGIPSVAMHLCKSPRANDSTIRQAIIDRYPGTGGGKKPQIGTKGQPGPLYGVSKDIWSALAVGLVYIDWYNERSKGI